MAPENLMTPRNGHTSHQTTCITHTHTWAPKAPAVSTFVCCAKGEGQGGAGADVWTRGEGGRGLLLTRCPFQSVFGGHASEKGGEDGGGMSSRATTDNQGTAWHWTRSIWAEVGVRGGGGGGGTRGRHDAVACIGLSFPWTLSLPLAVVPSGLSPPCVLPLPPWPIFSSLLPFPFPW